MAIKIGELLIDIRADTATLVSGMTQAQRQVEQTFAGMKRAAAEFAGFVGVGLSLAGLTEFVSQAIDTQVQIAKMSAATGVSAERFSELAFVAKATGTPIESLGKGLQFLDKNMVAAASGNATFLALFKKIGVDAVDPVTHQVRDAAVVFNELRDKLGTMSNQSEAAGIRMKLLGRGSGELAFMMGLSNQQFAEMAEEARRFGLVLDENGREALLGFHERLNILKEDVSGLATQFAVGLAPALTQVANGFAEALGGADGFKALGELLGDVVRELARVTLALAYDIRLVIFEAQRGFANMGATQLQASVFEGGSANPQDIEEQQRQADAAKKDAEQRSKDIDAQEKELDERFRKADALLDKKPGSSLRLPRTGLTPDLTPEEDVAKLGNELDKLSEKTRKLLDRDDGDKYARLLGDINQQLQGISRFESEHPDRIWANLNKQATDLRLALTDVEGKQRLILFEALANAEKPLLDSILKTPVGTAGVTGAAQAGAELIKLGSPEGTDDRNRRSLAIFNETRTATERYNIELAQLDILLQAGSIDQEEYARKVRLMREGLLASIDPLVQLQKRMRELADLQAAGANPLALKAADFDALQRFSQEWEQILVKQNNFGDSLHAALLHAATDAEQIGTKLYQAFTKAIEGLNQGLTDLAFGDKVNFQAVLKNFGKDIFKAELEKSVTGPLFGQLGGLLGIPGLGTKLDGSSEQAAMWVRLAGPGGGLLSSVTGGGGGGGGWLSSILGLFGGGGGGGLSAGTGAFTDAVTALPFTMPIPLFAGGGYLGPGEVGIAGDDGPELISGGRSGVSVTPLGGGHTFTFGDTIINAPGANTAELKAYIDQSHRAAVQQAVVAVEERRMRRAD